MRAIPFLAALATSAIVLPVYAQSDGADRELRSQAVKLLQEGFRCPLFRERATLMVSHEKHEYTGDEIVFEVSSDRSTIGFSEGLPSVQSSITSYRSQFSDIGRFSSYNANVSLECRAGRRCFGEYVNASISVCDRQTAENIVAAISVLKSAPNEIPQLANTSNASPQIAGLPPAGRNSSNGNRTLWDHNGSVVALSSEGTIRRIHYKEPRKVLADRGVIDGTLLFEGSRRGNTYEGTAYVFSSDCGAASYAVKGDVSADNLNVTLKGSAPRRNALCETIGTKPDTLVFTYRSAE